VTHGRPIYVKLLKRELYQFQKKGSTLSLQKDHFALFMEQGTGKTITALKNVAVRHRRNSVKIVLVLGPKSVVGSWERQIPLHLNTPHQIINGMSTEITKALVQAARTFDGITFILINYERARSMFRSLKSILWDMVIADESHRIKNRNSKTSKVTWRLGQRARHRLMLTGTPVDQEEIELYAQFRFLLPELFGTRWALFDRRFLRKSGFMGKLRKFKRGYREKMLNMIAPYVFSIKSADALDLPPSVDQAIYYDLTGKAKTAYNQIEKEFLYKFGDLTSTTPLAVTNMIRLQQLTGGFLGMDDGSLLELEQDRLIALSDWLVDVDKNEKLVIFARFRAEIDMIAQLMKRLGRSYVIRDGRTKPQDMNAWQDFQDKKDPNTYIAQIGSGGIGIDLFSSAIAIFYSKSFSYIEYEQARFRLTRNGQRRFVKFIHMIAKSTIDDLMLKAIDEKCLTANSIFTHLKHQRSTPMAKADKTAAAPAEEKTKKAPPPKKAVEFGVKRLSEATGIEPGDLRVLLRGGNYAETYKQGGNWDFVNQKNIDKIAKELQAAQVKKLKEKAAKSKGDEAAAAAKAAKVSEKAPAAAKAAKVSEEAPAAAKAAKVSEKAPAAAKAAKVSEEAPAAAKAAKVSEEAPAAAKAAKVSEEAPAAAKTETKKK
jgi:superfamily II DNA or RNA helicase